MSIAKTAELIATQKVGEQVAGVQAEMETWGDVQNKILDIEEGHSAMLGQILRAVQRAVDDAEGEDPLGDLLRQLLAANAEHAAGLKRVEDKVDALAAALRERP